MKYSNENEPKTTPFVVKILWGILIGYCLLLYLKGKLFVTIWENITPW